jgi:hypothetical protein
MQDEQVTFFYVKTNSCNLTEQKHTKSLVTGVFNEVVKTGVNILKMKRFRQFCRNAC